MLGGDITAYPRGGVLQSDVIRAFDAPAETRRRSARPARQPRSAGCDREALGGDRRPAGARGRGLRLRDHRGSEGQYRPPRPARDADTILVLKGCGPKGYPGMPEVGNMPIPRKLVEQGVRDMVRVSRRPHVRHGFRHGHPPCGPEAQAGGPLALVRTGDRIRISAAKGALELLVGRGRTRGPPRGLEARGRALRPRLREALRRSRPAGRQGRRSAIPRRARIHDW